MSGAPPAQKKARHTQTSNELRHGIWDLHIGRAHKTAKCPLCGITSIFRNTTAGFEAGHMIADKFMNNDTKLNAYYLYPCCTSCNLNCRTMCILDYLYCRLRYRELRQCIYALCTLYISDHDNLDDKNRMWAHILKHLYGPEYWKAGGGLVNEEPIYRMADQEQARWLHDRERQLLLEQEQIVRDKVYLSENVVCASQVNEVR